MHLRPQTQRAAAAAGAVGVGFSIEERGSFFLISEIAAMRGYSLTPPARYQYRRAWTAAAAFFGRRREEHPAAAHLAAEASAAAVGRGVDRNLQRRHGLLRAEEAAAAHAAPVAAARGTAEVPCSSLALTASRTCPRAGACGFPFVTFIIRMPVGSQREATRSPRRAIMSLLMAPFLLLDLRA